MRSFAFASYALYFLSGLVITTIGSVLPQLLAHYHVSYTIGGQLVFAGSVGFIIGVPISSFLINWFAEKNVLSMAAAIIAFAQFSIFFLPPIGLIFFLTFLNSIGVAMLETVVATLMMEVFIGRRAVVMSYLEVSFGLGALLMPIISSIFISQGIWRSSFIVTGCFAAVLVIVWQTISYSKDKIDLSETLDAGGLPPQFLSKGRKMLVLSLFMMMILMYTGIEGSLNNFLASIFIAYLDTVPYYASLSIGFFWAAMVVGRVATGWIIRKVTYNLFLFWGMAGTTLGLICFILFKNAAVGYGFVIIMGLTMSGVYSITMVYANHMFPGLARLVTSLITGFAGLGGAIFPALIGATMDRSGTATALWYVVAFAGLYLTALAAIYIFQLNMRKSTNVIDKHCL
ncbi:FHS family glucose/mannose:H+ symporter-like MFS transporter [Scopulibacillus darangshiensis]|uniref:FHS family glucose/mannose:H+ symporter-like MFS transporter n=1 Tax=Scopulibacillus darangshiensis TaxID=442528 RepID=A0A4R2P4F7_9BACL|nr:MFS transporter [Scopulibacillus darangshiensis]TCP29632.1 FHS family glucose/mannose:H+ symporter-like MFS transporter [Scopulibacillus darangshiensis]